MCANWSAPFNYVWYKLPDLKNKFEFSDFLWLVVRWSWCRWWWWMWWWLWWVTDEWLIVLVAVVVVTLMSDWWQVKNLKKSKWPANDSKITGLTWTENQNFFLLSHRFHDWVTGYASHSICPDRGSMVSYATVPSWPTSARFDRVDQVLRFCLHGIELRTSRLTARRLNPSTKGAV